jgi:hypothetical protein
MRKSIIGLWLVAVMFISGCQALDKADGIQTDPKTGVVTQNPVNPVTVVAGAASAIPGPGSLIAAALLLLGNVYGAFRVNQAKGNTAAALAAANATASGIGSVMPTLSPDVQAKIASAIGVAHDVNGVVQALQDSLQATATGHPAAIPVAPVSPAAATPA